MEEHILINNKGKWMCKQCGRYFNDLKHAMKHSSLFDNTPNAAKLMEALRHIYTSPSDPTEEEDI